MAYPFAPRLSGETIHGFKYFNALGNLLTPLHEVGTERDKAGNRKLFFDHYAGLILLYFFSPVLTSLRGIQQASGLKKVQRLLGKQKASLGSLSEASSVFDAEVLQGVIQELGARVTVPGVAPSNLSKIANRPRWTRVCCRPCRKWFGRCGWTKNTGRRRCIWPSRYCVVSRYKSGSRKAMPRKPTNFA
jgi:hypothetical protein